MQLLFFNPYPFLQTLHSPFSHLSQSLSQEEELLIIIIVGGATGGGGEGGGETPPSYSYSSINEQKPEANRKRSNKQEQEPSLKTDSQSIHFTQISGFPDKHEEHPSTLQTSQNPSLFIISGKVWFWHEQILFSRIKSSAQNKQCWGSTEEQDRHPEIKQGEH